MIIFVTTPAPQSANATRPLSQGTAMSDLSQPDNPAIIAHLNMLQSIIARLAQNSAQCKTWCLIIVSALFGLAGGMKDEKLVHWCIVPIVIFGVIDAAYLQREKAWRELFQSVVNNVRTGNYTIADCYDLNARTRCADFWSALCSWAVWPVYVGLIIAYILV